METENKKRSALPTVLALFLCMLLAVTAIVPMQVYAASISKKKATIYVGSSVSLSVKGTKKTPSWKSSNKKVATVSKAGKVTGKKAGKAKITATIGKKKYTCTVTVKKKPTLSKTSVTIRKGKSVTLKLNNAPAKVTWSSANKKVAKVSSKGKVTGVKKGTTTIYAKCSGKKYSCKVTVKGDPKLNATSITLNTGKTYKLSLVDAVKSVSWSSSNKTIAKVNSKGTVTAVAAGTTYIKAKSNGKTYKCKVTVKKPAQPAKTTYSSSGVSALIPKADACVRNAFEKMGFSVLYNRTVPYSGNFNAASRTITLRDYGTDVIYHELGHFVGFAAGNADRTESFYAIYQAEKGKYTAYNKTYVCSSASEYFAESYRNYVLDKVSLKAQRPRTYAVIQQAVSKIQSGSWEKIYQTYTTIGVWK